MAQPKRIASKPTATKRVKKKKGGGVTQHPEFQSVMVMGPTGKTRMVKRPW